MFVMQIGTSSILFLFITSVAKKKKKSMVKVLFWVKRKKIYVVSNYIFKLNYKFLKNLLLHVKSDKIYLKFISANQSVIS